MIVDLARNVPGQDRYWRMHGGNVHDLSPEAGVVFPGHERRGRLRPYSFDTLFGLPLLLAHDEQGVNREVLWDCLPGMRSHGTVPTAAGKLVVASFRYYKGDKNDPERREQYERIVALEDVGYGVLMPDHDGELCAPYAIGYQLGTCAVGADVDRSAFPAPSLDQLRNFSMPRMGLFGDPGADPGLREYWLLPTLQEQ